MNITSNWKLTWDPAGTPVVLVDYGQELDREIFPSLAKGLEVVPLIDATYPLLRMSKNAVISLSWRGYVDAADDAAARQAMMVALLTWATAGRKALKVEAYGITDRSWLFASAAVTQYTPGRVVDFPLARVETSWAVTATGMSQVGP